MAIWDFRSQEEKDQGINNGGAFGLSQEELNYEKELNSLQAKLQSEQLTVEQRKAIKNQIDYIQDQIGKIREFYQGEMQKQGTVDASGKLVAAKDVQEQYVDKDYLRMRAEQLQGRTAGTVAQAGRQALAEKASGRRITAASQLGAGEAVARQGQEQIAQEVRGETLRAKSEAGQELGRKEAYASKLTDMQRTQLKDQLNAQMQKLADDNQVSASLLQVTKQKLEEANDDMLIQLAGVLAKEGTGALVKFGLGLMTGGASAVGDAGGAAVRAVAGGSVDSSKAPATARNEWVGGR